MSGRKTPDGYATIINSGSPNLPGGCSPEVETLDVATLRLVLQTANRVTRREAERKLRKLAKQSARKC